MAALRRVASVALLLAALTGCQTVTDVLSGLDRPTARVDDVHITALDLEGAELSFDLAITNPYAVALPLTDLHYALSSRGRGILSGDAILDGTIPAQDERTITVPASIRFADLFEALRGLSPGRVLPYEAELDLLVDVPSIAGADARQFSIPLRHRDELPIPAVPEVSIESILWDEFSLNSARAVVQLSLGNRNDFAFDLRTLSYALSLSGLEVGSARVERALSLEAGEDGAIEIPISISPLALGQAALDVLQGARAEYRIGGEIEADTPYGLMRLPYERTGEARMTR